MKGKSNQFFSQFKDKFIFSFLLKRCFLHSIALRSIKTIPFVPKSYYQTKTLFSGATYIFAVGCILNAL